MLSTAEEEIPNILGIDSPQVGLKSHYSPKMDQWTLIPATDWCISGMGYLLSIFSTTEEDMEIPNILGIDSP